MNPNTFFKNAGHLFTSQIINIYIFFKILMNCFVPETEIWMERQKEVRCFRKKNYFKETNRVE